MSNELTTKQKFVNDLAKQNKHLEKEIREIKKLYDEKMFPKHTTAIQYPKESNFNLVQDKLLAKLNKNIEAYEKETEKLQQRIDLLTSNYPSKGHLTN